MPQRTLKIFVVLLFLIQPFSLRAQNIFQRPKTIQQVIGKINYEQKAWVYRSSPQYVKNITLDFRPVQNTASLRTLPALSGINFASTGNVPQFRLSPKYYSESPGFFCQQEFKFQRKTSVPLRFRLGSMDYVNYLEQKPNAIKPQ